MAKIDVIKSLSEFHLPSMIAKINSNGSPLYSSCKPSPRDSKSPKIQLAIVPRSTSLNDQFEQKVNNIKKVPQNEHFKRTTGFTNNIFNVKQDSTIPLTPSSRDYDNYQTMARFKGGDTFGKSNNNLM